MDRALVKYPRRQIGNYETVLDPLILEIVFLKSAFHSNVCLSPSVYDIIDSGPLPASIIENSYYRSSDLVNYLMKQCGCPKKFDQTEHTLPQSCSMSVFEAINPIDYIASFLRLSTTYYTWIDENVSKNYTLEVYKSSLPFPFSYIFYYLDRKAKIEECRSKGLFQESYVISGLNVIYNTLKPLLENGTFGAGGYADLDVIVFSSLAVLFSLPIKSNLFKDFIEEHKYLLDYVMNVNANLKIWPCKNTFLQQLQAEY